MFAFIFRLQLLILEIRYFQSLSPETKIGLQAGHCQRGKAGTIMDTVCVYPVQLIEGQLITAPKINISTINPRDRLRPFSSSVQLFQHSYALLSSLNVFHKSDKVVGGNHVLVKQEPWDLLSTVKDVSVKKSDLRNQSKNMNLHLLSWSNQTRPIYPHNTGSGLW